MLANGYTIEDEILTVTDTLDFHLAKQTYFYSQPEKRLDQDAFFDIQATFEDTSAENIMRLIIAYDSRSWRDQRNGVKITAYKNVDKALTKAINDYRDSWLDDRNGFELKEIP